MELTPTQKKLAKHLPERLDLDNPNKPQTPLNADDILAADEDENTAAKSLIDEIIEETENELIPRTRHSEISSESEP